MKPEVDISAIVPTLNEEDSIQATLANLQTIRGDGEVIVVDGGSTDKTVALARDRADQIIVSPPGRARQMNKGASIARGSILWFVHADTVVSNAAIDDLRNMLTLQNSAWGRFDIRLTGRQWLLRIIETMMNTRSRLTGIATGDQGMFINRQIFENLGGFADIPLMEDIEISKRLKSIAPPVCFSTPLLTSSRRWETHGVIRTMFYMWLLRFRYAMGESPTKLARHYPS